MSVLKKVTTNIETISLNTLNIYLITFIDFFVITEMFVKQAIFPREEFFVDFLKYKVK